MKIKIAELKKLMEKIVSSKYYPSEEAEKIVDVLLYAELTGKNTQGILKMLNRGAPQDCQPDYPPKVIRETPVSVLFDGGKNSGILVAQEATRKVIKIAQDKGFGIVGINNIYSSTGAIGYYTRKIAQNNLIGIVMASSPRTVAHFGGLEPTYGTNPIAFAFPTLESPIIFDMATSAITYFGLVRAHTLGEKLPDNVAIDNEGNITNDPKSALDGAILPYGGTHKGSGLGMVVELLAGVLPGASYIFDKPGDWGMTFIALSPSLLMDTDEFKRRSSDLIQKVKSGKTKNGGELRIPGYDSEKELQKIVELGEIDIEDSLLLELKKLV